MESQPTSLSATDRPDLDEFLSALGGFLDKQTSPQDPSYLRFLSMFCRSVGAAEGHMVRKNNQNKLSSEISFGLGPEFDEDFNRRHAAAKEPCPLDEAYQKKEVVAIVDLQKDTSTPAWFMDIMNKHHLKSMVAVPLLGHQDAIGILCAYYRDVCLFDQNTLDHLMMIGRMVGAATEKSAEAERAVSLGIQEKVLDDYLTLLTQKDLSLQQIYQVITMIVVKTLNLDALICGPVRKAGDGLALTIAAGEGIPPSMVAHRYELPPFVVRALGKMDSPGNFPVVKQKEWGGLSHLMKLTAAKPLCFPFFQGKKLNGALIGWKEDPEAFGPSDLLLVSRLARVTSLALNAGKS